MDLDDIRLFVSVAERKSFAKAAEELRIQNSMLSRRVARLEASLGVRLLQRTTRRVALTEEGRRFLAEAREGLGQLQSAVDSLHSIHGTPQGTVRVSSPIDIGQLFVPEVLPGFLAAYPRIHIDWDMVSFSETLIEKGFDLTIIPGETHEKSLITKYLGKLRRHVYCSPKMKLQFKKRPTVEDIEALPWLQFIRGGITSYHEPIDLEFDGVMRQIHPKNIVFRSNGLTPIRSMVLAGMGVAVLPPMLVESEVKQGLLVPLLPDLISGGDLSFYAAYPSREYLAPKVRVFLDWLAAKSSLALE